MIFCTRHEFGRLVVAVSLCVFSATSSLAQTLRQPSHVLSPTALCWSKIGSVTFIGPGEALAVADSLGNVSLWNIASGSKPRWLLESCISDPVRTLEASPDGKSLSVVWADRALILDLATGRVLRTVSKYAHHGGDAELIGIAMDPNCRVLAFTHERPAKTNYATGVLGLALGRGEMPMPGGRSAKRVVSLWDAVNDRLIRVLDSGETVQFSRSGRIAAVQDNRGTITLYDAAAGERISAIENKDRARRSFAISADGRQLAVASGDSLTIWDVVLNKQLTTFPVGSSGLLADAFDHSAERIITVSGDGTLLVWGVTTGRVLWKLVGKQSLVTEIDFSSDGSRVSAVGVDNRIHVWTLPPFALN